jgi:hypothetical protein
MRRVIVPGGRAVIATWCPLEQQGAYAALDAVSRQRTGEPIFAAPFSLGDAAELNKLLVDAKFFAVQVDTVTRQVRIPDPPRFAALMLGDDGVADGLAALAPFIDGEQITFPLKSLIAVARVKT